MAKGEDASTPEEKAERLKTLAEQRYNQSNHKSALKYSKRALRLLPNDTSISDMVTTFKILYTYSKSPTTPDWYEILQTEPFSHINTIKKSYKKLALSLHPDKNTCIASVEAFKCVSEAFQVLSDKIRRKEYDLKLRIALQAQATEGVESTGSPVDTFWTACSGCRLFHQYERRYVGSKLLCPSCKKSFVAEEVVDDDEVDGDEDGDEDEDDGVEDREDVDDVGDDDFDNGVRGKRRIDELGDGVGEKRGFEELGSRVRRRKYNEDFEYDFGERRRFDDLENGVRKRRRIDDLDNGVRGARGKRRLDDFENGVGEARSPESSPRFNLRSRRTKSGGEMTLAEMQMEAKRKLAEEKRKKMKGKEDKVEKRKGKEKEKGKRREERSMVVHRNQRNELEVMKVVDSDFNDFDKDRSERCFKRSQVWAVYDDDDGMPRLYGLIDEVLSVYPFEVKMSWLDTESLGDERLICWEKSGFHISCGRFKVNPKKTTVVNSVNIFSHPVECERVAREIYWVYPKKGSVWALYNERILEVDDGDSFLRENRCYDIVVFLTTYSEMHGLSMAYLEKVEGFKTIFKRREIGCHDVKWLEKSDFRLFSHQIPAKKLTLTEVPDVPGDCWELDPASLPSDLLTIEQG